MYYVRAIREITARLLVPGQKFGCGVRSKDCCFACELLARMISLIVSICIHLLACFSLLRSMPTGANSTARHQST